MFKRWLLHRVYNMAKTNIQFIQKVLLTIQDPDVKWYRCDFVENSGWHTYKSRILPCRYIQGWAFDVPLRVSWLWWLPGNFSIGVLSGFFKTPDNQLGLIELFKNRKHLKRILENCKVIRSQEEYDLFIQQLKEERKNA